MQTTKIVYNRKKRNTLHNNGSKFASNKNWSLRGDEIYFGALVLVENISILDKYLVGPARTPFQFPRHMFIIVITNSNEPHFEEASATFLRKLWLNYGIANAILITPCPGESEVCYFHKNYIFQSFEMLKASDEFDFRWSAHISHMNQFMMEIQQHGVF